MSQWRKATPEEFEELNKRYAQEDESGWRKASPQEHHALMMKHSGKHQEPEQRHGQLFNGEEFPHFLTNPKGAAEEAYETLIKRPGITAFHYLDKLNTAADHLVAPLRAGARSYQKGEGLADNAKAVYDQIGAPPHYAPTYTELFEHSGLPKPVSSAAGIGTEFILNPVNKIGSVAKGASDALRKVAPALKEFANQRAVKAMTGQNIHYVRQAANVTKHNPGSAERAFGNIDKLGDMILTEPGALKHLDTVQKAFPKMSQIREGYGKKIGQIADEIDKSYKNSVSTKNIARKMRDFASKIPKVEKGKVIAAGIEKDAHNIESLGPISFREGQRYKNQFKHEPTHADAHISNKDAANMVENIFRKEMEETADKIVQISQNALNNMQKNHPSITNFKELEKVKDSFDKTQKLVSKYKEYKSKYHTFKFAESATADRTLKDLSNRWASPSSYITGSAAAIASAKDPNLVKNFAVGVLAGAANEFAKNRGSAFAARTAHDLQKMFTHHPEALNIYGKIIIDAAERGAAALVATHHTLLKTNPEYRALFQQEEEK